MSTENTMKPMAEEIPSRWAKAVGDRPPWKSRSAMVAGVLVLIGLFFWLTESRNLQTRGSDDSSISTATGSTRSSKVLEPTSPATFRLGASYLGGFLIGWMFRRFIKLSALVAAFVLGGIAILKKVGWIDLDWASIEGHVHHSLAWVQGGAESIKNFLTGYLPSSGAAAVGSFWGFRRK